MERINMSDGYKSQIMHRRHDCRGCRGQNLVEIFSLNPSPIGDAYVQSERVTVNQPLYPIDLHMCKDCGLAQLLDVIDPDILYGDYIYLTESSVGLSEHFARYAPSVVSKCKLKKGDLVIDIGSNDGTLLEYFRQLEFNVLGIEPAPKIAAYASSKGINTINSFLTPGIADQIIRNFGKASVVTANNVMANIDDLDSWMIAIEKLLDGGGVFVFESFYLADVVNNLVFDFIYHEHLSAFSVKPIQALLNRFHLELASVQRVPTKGGSLRFFAQRPDGPIEDDGSVQEALFFEESMGLHSDPIFFEFAERVNALKVRLKMFLDQAKREGKLVVGFGASITATTLIYHFEIGDYLEFLVDDNVAKQGLYSPGLHLPVFAPSVLAERKPDYVVILAWRFVDRIMEKNSVFLRSSEAIVVPVPEFRMVENV